MIFACISTPYMLLAPAYAVQAELCVELNGDGTGGFVQEFVDLLAFVVPDCRGSFHVWGTAITSDFCALLHSSTQGFQSYAQGPRPLCSKCVLVLFRGAQCLRFSTNSEVVGAPHSSDAVWWRYCTAQSDTLDWRDR